MTFWYQLTLDLRLDNSLLIVSDAPACGILWAGFLFAGVWYG
jgi:hypothetical protein